MATPGPEPPPGGTPEPKPFQKPAFNNVKAPEGKGYYYALGLEFGCTQAGAVWRPTPSAEQHS